MKPNEKLTKIPTTFQLEGKVFKWHEHIQEVLDEYNQKDIHSVHNLTPL